MKTIVIDGGCMPDREAVHDYLARRLTLPEYYGRNLDALYDLLCGRGEPTRLVLYRQEEMLAALEQYGQNLLDTLRDAALENPALVLCCDGEDN